MNTKTDWMARYFFAGGIMPSKNLFDQFSKDLRVETSWDVNGVHYQKTLDAWLDKLDQKNNRCWYFWNVYGAKTTRLALANVSPHLFELFGYKNGDHWGVTHYRFAKKRVHKFKFYIIIMWVIITFFFLHWYLSAFIQSFYQHRCVAHSMFTMNRFWDRFFYFALFCFRAHHFFIKSPMRFCITNIIHTAIQRKILTHHTFWIFSHSWLTQKYHSSIRRGEFKTYGICSTIACLG